MILRGHLLAEEKRLREVREGQLVFVGMHNVAQVHWCPTYAVLKSRANELEFFQAYVQDRTDAGARLGLTPAGVVDWPHVRPDVLDLRLAQVEPSDVQLDVELPTTSTELPTVELRGDDPLELGYQAEDVVAEKYPSFRWAFRWRSYVILGIPDGLTKSFVYEFKMARNPYLASITQPSALTQADLYGLCFRRPQKRVQTYIREDNRLETIHTLVDSAHAKSALKMFAAIDSGQASTPPDEKWKCRKCEVRPSCTIGHK